MILFSRFAKVGFRHFPIRRKLILHSSAYRCCSNIGRLFFSVDPSSLSHQNYELSNLGIKTIRWTVMHSYVHNPRDIVSWGNSDQSGKKLYSLLHISPRLVSKECEFYIDGSPRWLLQLGTRTTSGQCSLKKLSIKRRDHPSFDPIYPTWGKSDHQANFVWVNWINPAQTAGA